MLNVRVLNENDASSAAANDAGFGGKNDNLALPSGLTSADAGFAGENGTLALLDTLAFAVAIGTEAGKDVDEVRAGSIELKVKASLAQSCRYRAFGWRRLSLRAVAVT